MLRMNCFLCFPALKMNEYCHEESMACAPLGAMSLREETRGAVSQNLRLFAGTPSSHSCSTWGSSWTQWSWAPPAFLWKHRHLLTCSSRWSFSLSTQQSHSSKSPVTSSLSEATIVAMNWTVMCKSAGCHTWIWRSINGSVNLGAETSEVVLRGHILNGLFRQLLHSETFTSSGNLTGQTHTHTQGTFRDISNLDPLWKKNGK